MSGNSDTAFFIHFLIVYFNCASICGNNFLILSIILFSRGLSAESKGSAVSRYVLAFKQVLADDEKNTNALYSLGTLSYNKAALVLKNAAPLANSDKAKYDAQKEIADKNFQNAKTYLETALPLLSADKPREKSMIDNIKKLLPQIEAQLKRTK